MAIETTPSTEETSQQRELTTSEQHARNAWGAVGVRIRSITPSILIRSLVVFTGLAGLVWLGWSTWPALMPFLIGGIIAYTMLPVVNWMDRLLPRYIAVLISMIIILATIGGVAYMIVQVLGQQLYNLYQSLPNQETLYGYIEDLDKYVATLPVPVQETIDTLLRQGVDRLRGNLDLYNAELVDVAFTGLMAVFTTVSFVLGFLVIPAWLLEVLKDQKVAVDAANRLLPNWMKDDAWAIIRIIDRSFRAFLHGQLVLGLFVTLAVYIGLQLLAILGFDVEARLTSALFAGFMQLIPTIGPIVVVVVILLSGLTTGAIEAMLAVLVMYLIVLYLINALVAPKVERTVVADIHPALLVMAIVALSEFGILWIPLAAPITAVVRDSFRYIFGRVSDPPRPAGMLPIEPEWPLWAPARHQDELQPQKIPLAYRRGRAARRT